MHRSYEKFEDTTVAIRRGVYRRTDNPMSKIKRTNNYLLNSIQETKS
jgi:hypothetical protein